MKLYTVIATFEDGAFARNIHCDVSTIDGVLKYFDWRWKTWVKLPAGQKVMQYESCTTES